MHSAYRLSLKKRGKEIVTWWIEEIAPEHRTVYKKALGICIPLPKLDTPVCAVWPDLLLV